MSYTNINGTTGPVGHGPDALRDLLAAERDCHGCGVTPGRLSPPEDRCITCNGYGCADCGGTGLEGEARAHGCRR